MPRDDGFAVADVSTSKHTDPKFRRLWRMLAGDEDGMNAAVALYEAVTLASWGQGERVEADEAAPFWMSETREAMLSLQKVGLLDEDGMIPQHAWDSWYLPAYGRREQRREAGRIGGQNSRPPKPPHNNGGADPKQTSSDASPTPNPSVPFRSDPSVPSGPTVPSPRAREEKHGSKEPETDVERLARYRELRDDASQPAYLREAAKTEVERLEVLRPN